MQAKITVVTISYNQSRYLRECIDSVLEQGISGLEYIVVDPGSTDGSREIIDSYGCKIKKIYEKDSGPADGLNKGFAGATSGIYCYLNSDDRLLPGALAKVLNLFVGMPEVDIVYGACNIIDADSKKLRVAYSDKFSPMFSAHGASVIIQPSTFFRKEIFTKVGGFNCENRSNWDGELFIDMMLAGARAARIPDILSDYRVHDLGITGSGKMVEAHKAYSDRMFKKIMGREKTSRDVRYGKIIRLAKHLANPKATIERLTKGPIFGSSGK